MRILLIHNFYQFWGGEDSYVTSLEKLLKEKKHKVYLYKKDSNEIKTFWDKFKTGLGMFYSFNIKRELTDVIKNFRPDVAHFHNVYPLITPIAYRICKKFKIPIIQHIHNYRFMCPKGVLFRDGKICELCLHQKFPFWSIVFGCYHRSKLASLFFSLSFYWYKFLKTFDLIDMFIFPSEFTRDYYRKHIKINKSKTTVIPYFVNIKKPEKKIKKENYFLFVGRLSEEKGIIELLEIFKTLPDIRLKVIGDGPLKKKVEEYQKYRNIKIIGFLPKDKIYQNIQKAKAVIIPPLWYEVFPYIYIEALLNNTNILVPSNLNFYMKDLAYNRNIYLYNQKEQRDLISKILYLYKTKINKNFLLIEHNRRYMPQIHYKFILKTYHEIITKKEIFSRNDFFYKTN